MVEAVRAQAGWLLHVSNLYHAAPSRELAELLCRHWFAERVFLRNSAPRRTTGARRLVSAALDPPPSDPFLRGMRQLCQRVTESAAFHGGVLALILAAGVIVGLETDREVTAAIGGILFALDRAILALFALELALRIGAHGARPWRFFADPWNVFDFVVVGVCLLPLHAEAAAVLRLARVLRVLRLVTAVPELQILVGALMKSFTSMGWVSTLLMLHFYVFAVLGVTLFGAHDAEHFGSIGAAMLTLFQVVTLEGWVDIMRIQIAGLGSGVVPVTYFVTFILLGTMIMLNLLIGVIVNGMEEAREETEAADRARHRAADGRASASDDVAALQRQLGQLQHDLETLRRRLAA